MNTPAAWGYLENVGTSFDVFLNSILGGLPGQTISMRSALARQRGAKWGCVVCAILSVVVSPHHCADMLADRPTKLSSAIRAGIAMLACVWLVLATLREIF